MPGFLCPSLSDAYCLLGQQPYQATPLRHLNPPSAEDVLFDHKKTRPRPGFMQCNTSQLLRFFQKV